jgi:hypothetical protein
MTLGKTEDTGVIKRKNSLWTRLWTGHKTYHAMNEHAVYHIVCTDYGLENQGIVL